MGRGGGRRLPHEYFAAVVLTFENVDFSTVRHFILFFHIFEMGKKLEMQAGSSVNAGLSASMDTSLRQVQK